MKRIGLFLNSVMLAVAFFAPVYAAADSEESGDTQESEVSTPFFGGFLKRTQLIYPIQIDDWRFDDFHRYERPELGVSLRYVNGKHPGSRLDVFVYPGGMLDKADVKRMAEQELASLARTGTPESPYSSVDQGRLREFSLRRPGSDGKKKEEIKGFSMDMQVVREGSSLNSIYLLLVDRLYLIKVRHSAPEKERSRRKLRKLGESFVQKFVAGSVLNSTGACWRAVPVEPLTGETVDPAEVLIESQDDDKGAAYLLEDRILTDHPDSPDILLLQMMRMIMAGEWAEGCVAPEWMDQEPKAGQGEIFFSYE